MGQLETVIYLPDSNCIFVAKVFSYCKMVLIQWENGEYLMSLKSFGKFLDKGLFVVMCEL